MSRHRLLTLLLAAGALTGAGTAALAANAPLEKAATFVCSVLVKAPAFDDATHFAPAFRQSITHAALVQALTDVATEFGDCSKATVAGETQFLMASGDVVDASLSVDPAGLITGLRFLAARDPTQPLETWDDVRGALRQLSGHAGAALVRFGKTPLVQTAGSDEPLAVGSTFKLAVLATLSETIKDGKLDWNRSLPLRDDWKSLPSGQLQDLPTTYSPSVFEFAQKMISISDNTATDHLIHYVGRDRVEAMLPVLGVAPHQGNDPFLMTLDFFKLKWAVTPAQTQAYIDASPAKRQEILDGLVSIPRDKVCSADPAACEKPTAIEAIEWFFTPEEACRVIGWLDEHGDANVHEVLATNTGLASAGDGSHWSYVGFKGGSEPGVLSVTQLLHAKDGKTGCLTMTWNDPTRPVSELRFFGLARKALELAEAFIP